MALETCPTCSGSGFVPAHVADALNKTADHAGKTCHCDGPPHLWSKGWCPASGLMEFAFGVICLLLCLSFADDKDKTMAWVFGILAFLLIFEII